MFLALYFATEEDGTDVACNDNDSSKRIFPDACWYATALDRLKEQGRTWNDAHAAALASEPLG